MKVLVLMALVGSLGCTSTELRRIDYLTGDHQNSTQIVPGDSFERVEKLHGAPDSSAQVVMTEYTYHNPFFKNTCTYIVKDGKVISFSCIEDETKITDRK